MNCEHVHLWEGIIDLEDLREVVHGLMGMFQGPAALLSKASGRIHTDWELLAAIFALREVFDVLKVSKSPGEKLCSLVLWMHL